MQNNQQLKSLVSKKLKSPPSGGDKHTPADGCGWGVFVVGLVIEQFAQYVIQERSYPMIYTIVIVLIVLFLIGFLR